MTDSSSPQRAPARRLEAARVADLVLVCLLLPIALVLGVLIVAAIVLDSPGPAFFACTRVGRGGRPFTMLKFRTMTREAEGPPLRAAGDPRQTPVGRVLSESRLDELPQLLNVLRGDMRLVGPRPESAEFVAEQPEAYAEILAVPPGLTGVTQLCFADEGLVLAAVAPEERRRAYVERLLPGKVELDLAYVRGRSLARDLRILLRTLTVPMPLERPRPGHTARLPVWRALPARAPLALALLALPSLYGALMAAPSYY